MGNKLMAIGKCPSSNIEFDYINWKGEFGHRKVIPTIIYYGSTEYHQEEQWLLEGIDLDKGELRIFAMKDMSNVQNLED